MNYQFNVEIASRLDVNSAIFIHNIAFWIKGNKANNRHLFEGRYWTYNSTKAFAELFPFWTQEQVRRIISKLEDKGIIASSNLNKTKYDRTKWYTIIDEKISKMYDLSKSAHLGKSTNGSVQINKPIPYSKPDNKQKKIIIKDFESKVEEIYQMYPTTCYTTKKSTNKSRSCKTKIKHLIEKGGEGRTSEARYEWLVKSMKIYLEESKKTGTWIKNFNTFLNNVPDYGERTREITSDDRVNSYGTLIPNKLPNITQRGELPADMKTFVNIEGVDWYFKEEWLTREQYATRKI